jgi:hypothetical protein
MAEAPLKTDLILEGRIADFPITVRGTLENGDFAGFSGSITIQKTLAEILSALGFNPQNTKDPAKILNDLTGGLMSKIALDSLAVGYRSLGTKFTQIVVTMSAGGNTFRFVILKLAAGGFVVGLDLRWDPEFFKNNVLSGLVGEISIKDLGIYYASGDFRQVKYDPGQDFQDINTLVPSIPETGGHDFKEGLNWSAKLLVGKVSLLDWPGLEKEDVAQRVKSAILRLPPGGVSEKKVAKQLNMELRDLQNSLRINGISVRALRDEAREDQKLPQPAPGQPSEPQLPEVATRWIELDKSIGPLSVKRIGLSYIAPRAAVKFDAGLNLSCLTFSLLGLGLSYPINDFSFDVNTIKKNLKFQLDGAALALNVGPVTVGGSLLKVSDAPLQLDGSLIVRVETFSIAAIGSYANLKGVHSLFLFGALQYPLGGPPYFFITGVAFGFGLNRALVIPPINDVHNFPLVRAATDTDYLSKNLDPRMMSNKLQVYIHASPGNFWMAAGLKFTTFGLLDSFVLASVSLGARFEVALLGLAKLQLPKQRAIANVELALKVVFAPDRGFLAVEAALTENSYILAKEFKLFCILSVVCRRSRRGFCHFHRRLSSQIPDSRPLSKAGPGGIQLPVRQCHDQGLRLLCPVPRRHHGRRRPPNCLSDRRHQSLVHCICRLFDPVETGLL